MANSTQQELSTLERQILDLVRCLPPHEQSALSESLTEQVDWQKQRAQLQLEDPFTWADVRAFAADGSRALVDRMWHHLLRYGQLHGIDIRTSLSAAF